MTTFGIMLRRADQFPPAVARAIRYVSLIKRRAGTVLPTLSWSGFLEALSSAVAVAPDRGEIERDYRTIRAWEQQGPYTAPGAN